MLHALFLLAFILIAAPLASYVPLAALAALLITVAWNMAEKHSFATLLRGSRGDAVVLLATFGLTVFRSLMEGIVVGFALAALLFLHRMSESVAVEAEEAPFATDKDIVVYRISGAFFFGAAATVAAALDRIAAHPNAYVIDFSAVAIIDSTAAITIEGFMRKARKLNAAVYISGAGGDVRDELLRHGVREPQVSFRDDIQAAIAAARAGAG
jgi:SulP family sulfate permease